jgi:hypothetical protein
MFEYSQMFLLSVFTFYTLTTVVSSFSDACARLAKRRTSTFKLKPISEILETSDFYKASTQSEVTCSETIKTCESACEHVSEHACEHACEHAGEHASKPACEHTADCRKPVTSLDNAKVKKEECLCKNCCTTCKCS